MEDLYIMGEELQEVKRGHSRQIRFSEPTVTIMKRSMYFNSKARGMIGNTIKWSVSPNFVVGLPGKVEDDNSFTVNWNNNFCRSQIPAEFKNEKKIMPGHYKLYPYKKGFFFKRYEPLEGEL